MPTRSHDATTAKERRRALAPATPARTIEREVAHLTACVQPWAYELCSLPIEDTRGIIEEVLLQLQQVLVEHGRCELPYIGRIERTPTAWHFVPDEYALGQVPPASSAAAVTLE